MSGLNVFGRVSPRMGARQAAEVVGAARKTSRGQYGTGTVICDWQSNGSIGSPSGSTGATAALDMSVLFNGQPTMKYTMGAVGTFQCTWTFSTPVTVAQLKTMQFPFRISRNSDNSGGQIFNSANIWLNVSSGGTVRHSLYASGRRPNTFFTLSAAAGGTTNGWAFGAPVTTTTDLDADAATISGINLVISVGAEEVGESVWLGPITANRRNEGIVVIALDGQYSSQDRWILPMLESQGLRGTMFLHHSAVGDSGYMTYAQINRAFSVGHEIGHHTYGATIGNGYSDTSQYPARANIYADIAAGVQNLRARGYINGPLVATHGGSVMPYTTTVANQRQLDVVSAYQDAGMQAILAGTYPGGVYNRLQPTGHGDIDPYCCVGAVQITNTTTPANITDIIDAARERGELAVIKCHRSVVATPSALEMTNADMLTWITYLGQQVRAGGVLNMTFGETMRHVGAI